MSAGLDHEEPGVESHAAREALADELAGQRLRCGAGGDAQRARPVANEVADRARLALGHQAAVDEHDDARRHALDLVQHVRGDEHGAALGSPSRRISSTTWRRCTGSRPFSGSSSSSSSGECTSAWASLTRWRMPFEKPPTRRSAASSSPTVASASAAALRGSGTSRRPAIELDQLARREERPEAVAVVHDADPPVDLGLAARIVPEHAHRAGARIGEPGAQRERGRLAGAVVAEQAGHAGRQLERDLAPGRRCRRTTWRRPGRRASDVCPPVAPPQASRRDGHDDPACAPTTTSRRARAPGPDRPDRASAPPRSAGGRA